MDFGIMFFASAGQETGGSKYRLLLDAVRFADQRGFRCVWTPERHFHPFGGLYPNPAVLSAALATITERLELRAGSLISPLHHAVRIAEEWSVVDNLSGGRVALSFGSGWNVDDFIFFPDRYAGRQAFMYRQIETVRHLWRGGTVRERNSFGREVEIRIYPRPVRPELPVWITSSGNAETFASAGKLGANLLTHLIGQDLATLAGKIERYRDAREEAGHARRTGTVTLMLHTFVGGDMERVRATVRAPFREYLRVAISLEEKAAIGGGVISGGHRIEAHQISETVMEDLLDATFERYFQTGALMGTPARLAPFVRRLEEIGVDEIACLIDFGVGEEQVLAALEPLDALRRLFSEETAAALAEQALAGFLEDLEE
ncbi:MAG TPA: MupA/Atu3671 family FMN-dependent luciferase-like monooxygenase [Thermoanaerobaculia bacterium]|nr:MupA/Atu3671 family FMN-dependent luciferase-like monooxygenase [Thermoanaerobaculia bacterium]